MAASSPRFVDLPWEIRSQIWEYTAEPRTVDVNITRSAKPVTDELRAKFNLGREHAHPWITITRFRSPTPVPAALHACREARNHLTTKDNGGLGHYQRVFHQLPPASWGVFVGILPLHNPDFRLFLGVDPESESARYIWVNFEVDLINIGKTRFDAFPQFFEHSIRRLKFESAYDYNKFKYDSHLEHWVNLQEIQIVCTDGIEKWVLLEDVWGLWKTRNVLLIDGKTRTGTGTGGEAETVTSYSDLAARFDLGELRAARYRKRGARINPDTHVPLVPWLPPRWLEGEHLYGLEYYYDNGEEEWKERVLEPESDWYEYSDLEQDTD
ncbi:hypothetical protein B0T09DRAFT_280215 [Sordaria sp. MPI-SDFR-AT-0083]|nr:hypothetical protein B0T09DRAFT_280215 [Sordaria sp. MPI-SDFR-AT-0083]